MLEESGFQNIEIGPPVDTFGGAGGESVSLPPLVLLCRCYHLILVTVSSELEWSLASVFKPVLMHWTIVGGSCRR